jgi:Transposase domain (DUF772)
MAGLTILKSMHDLSDEALCERWVENPYFQLFCGEEFFERKTSFDRSPLTRPITPRSSFNFHKFETRAEEWLRWRSASRRLP